MPFKIAIANLSPPIDESGWWTLDRINVPDKYRGRGHGSALLREVLTDADMERITIDLAILPSGPLDWDDLEQWYTRHGFRRVGMANYMIRKPNADNS